MAPMKRALLPFLISTSLLLPGCAEAPTAHSSVLSITVSPLPLLVRWACPQHAPTDPPPTQCFLSMDPVVSVNETGGVGGRIVSAAVGVRDLATGAEMFTVGLSPEWMRSNAGTDRIEANAKLDFRVIVTNYPLRYSARPNLRLVFGARVMDDRGNELTPGLQVDIN